MPSPQARHGFGALIAALAVMSIVLLIQGLKGDAIAIGAGLLTFAIVIGLVGWRFRNAATHAPSGASPLGEPKPATAPPDGHIRFTVAVENLSPTRIAELWSDLCRPNSEVTEAFRLLYRNFTVLEGNRFRFIKGEPQATAALLADVLSAAAGTPVRTIVEPAAERTPLWS